jgi:hypothetical protein
MRNSRYLLLLFGLAFLSIQIVSFVSSVSEHEEIVVKLATLTEEVESGNFFDLRIDPQVYTTKENKEFSYSIFGFLTKIFVIGGATMFVFLLIGRKMRKSSTQ